MLPDCLAGPSLLPDVAGLDLHLAVTSVLLAEALLTSGFEGILDVGMLDFEPLARLLPAECGFSCGTAAGVFVRLFSDAVTSFD